MIQIELQKHIEKSLWFLKNKKKVLFLTTSNRHNPEGGNNFPKSSILADTMKQHLPSTQVEIIDVSQLNIFPCNGNVSNVMWNVCGLKDSQVKDIEKNPTGYTRCWVSAFNEKDELWKVSKAMFESDCVVFFTSVRRWQTNAIYQKLIERLTWIENRHSSLWEDNIVKDISAGIIVIGQNWNGEEILKTQKQVLEFYGFDVVSDICWNWQYLKDAHEESNESYKQAIVDFKETVSPSV